MVNLWTGEEIEGLEQGQLYVIEHCFEQKGPPLAKVAVIAFDHPKAWCYVYLSMSELLSDYLPTNCYLGV